MSVVWTVLGVLVLLVGWRTRQRWKADHDRGAPAVDDAAIQRIIEEGTLPGRADHEALDLEAAAEAEEDFWSEYWDEPDEYQT